MSPRKESGDVLPNPKSAFWAWPVSAAPRTCALQIAVLGGLEAPKVFASGRPLVAHVDPSTAWEVDSVTRAGGNAVSSTTGSSLTLVCVTSGSSGKCVTQSSNGKWILNWG